MGFLVLNATCLTQTLESVPTLGRGADLDHKSTELGDARYLSGPRGCAIVSAGLGTRRLSAQLVQQCLHSQIRDVGSAFYVLLLLLLLLGEWDAAIMTGSLEALQERFVVVGGVVGGGDAQDVGEDVEPLARSNECFTHTHVFTRVLTLQRDEIENERARDPGIVDVMRSDAHKSLGVG